MAKYCMLLVEVDYPKFFMLKISKMRLKKIKNRLAAAEMNAVEGGFAYGGVPIQNPLSINQTMKIKTSKMPRTHHQYD